MEISFIALHSSDQQVKVIFSNLSAIKMRFKMFKFLLFLTLVEFISCKGWDHWSNYLVLNFNLHVINRRFFTIVGSKLMRHQGKYQVSVTCQDFSEPPTLELAIRNSSSTGVTYKLTQNVTLINGQTQMIEFDVSLCKFLISSHW